MKKFKLKADVRKVFGRKVKVMRNEGLTPSNIFGKKVKSLAIKIDEKEFIKLFKEAGETSIIEISVGKETRPCLVHGMQKDPVTEKILHVDFHQVDLKEKVSASVPVEIVGESPAVKQGLGTLVAYIDEVEVEALPMDLPEKFEVDVSKLEDVDGAIFVKDLSFDKSKIELGVDPEEMVAKIEALREEEETPVVEETEGEEGEEGEEGAGGEESEDEGGEESEESKEDSAVEEKSKEK